MTPKLQIITKDNRILYTQVKNLPYILEYVRHQECKINLVNTSKGLSLDNLAEAFCSTEHDYSRQPYTLLKKVYPPVSKRQHSLRASIRSKFILEGEVRMDELKSLYPKATSATLATCLTSIKKELASSGFAIEKVRKGIYRIKAD